MSGEYVSVKVCARVLGVSVKTVYRYLSLGRLTRLKEGYRTYVSMDEVRSLKGQLKPMSEYSMVNVPSSVSQVSLSNEEYKSLMTEVVELRERNRLLIEYKGTRDKEIQELKKRLQEVQVELNRLKKNPFRRLVDGVFKK